MEKRNIFDMQRQFSVLTNQDRNRTRRVVFYGRVSTEHEAQLSALENQIQWYDDQAAAHKNWVILEKYIDEGITGTQAKKRPAFLRMLEDARAGKFDLIVTREVCRFARNTVDTLVVTRELKNLGIEVYFVEDNIWTMDGDGELRLTIMATLAQEESRKVSERVRAGQHISREQGAIYGSGNILGYDRVGRTYVINKEQAKTVRMIFDLYLEGKMGVIKIANRLIEEGRPTATGTLKWTHSNIERILNNPTYMGVLAYGKSYSNNYLDQKRINNHNKDTYIYKKADFEPIVTEEEFWKVQEIKAKRVRETFKTKKTIFGEEYVKSPARQNNDKWGAVIRCGCGSRLRKNRWHKNKGMPWTYGYECYNQLNNGSAKKMRSIGADDTGHCDRKMVADWKFELMGREILRTLWNDRKAAIEEACDIIKSCYVLEKKQGDETAEAKRRLGTLQQKIANLREMRLDGDIDQQSFHEKLRILMDEESEIRAEIEDAGKIQKSDEVKEEAFDYDKVKKALQEMLDFENSSENGILDPEVVTAFVKRVIIVGNGEFAWFINLSGRTDTEVCAILEGRKKKATLALFDSDKNVLTPEVKGIIMEKENFFHLSDLKKVAGDNSLVQESSRVPIEHRLLSQKCRTSKIYFRMVLEKSSARAYRKSMNLSFRPKVWKDLTVHVFII